MWRLKPRLVTPPFDAERGGRCEPLWGSLNALNSTLCAADDATWSLNVHMAYLNAAGEVPLGVGEASIHHQMRNFDAVLMV